MAPDPRRQKSLSSRITAVTVFGVVFVILVIAGSKLKNFSDKTPKYFEAISTSSSFREPVTLTLNQTEIPRRDEWVAESSSSRVSVADVLEAAGFITIVETNRETLNARKSADVATSDPLRIRTMRTTNEEQVRNSNSYHRLIELTEKGRSEAAGWKIDESAQDGNSVSNTSLWHIPIGERELVRIESVTPGVPDSGNETITVSFNWRWRPNKLGTCFDNLSAALPQQAPKVRRAVRLLGWDSHAERNGTAKLRRRGAQWEVVELRAG